MSSPEFQPRHRYCIVALLATILAFGAIPPSAATTTRTIPDFQPFFLGEELYTEGWDQYFYFADGTLVTVQVLITNLGIGDHRAVVLGSLIQPNGERRVIKNGRPRKDWTFAEDGFDFKIARHRITGTPPDYRISLDNKNGRLELEYRSLVPPWRLGRTFEKSSDDYQAIVVYAPQLSAEGRFQLGPAQGGKDEGEPWQALKGGRGFALRYLNTAGVSRLFSEWIKVFPVDPNNGPIPVMYLGTTSEGSAVARLALYDEGVLRHDVDGFSFTTTRRRLDDSKDDRALPYEINVDLAKSGLRIVGTIKLVRLLHRFDLVDDLKPIERVFVRFVNTPIQYRFLAEYDLRYRGDRDAEERRLSGQAVAEIMRLNYD